MDLKFKGTTWAGNIFHKFEAMYQEVDDFVSQETVKYVENQVQTVGRSMQKICSGVVQDLLPPFLDPVKHEAQAVPQKQNDAIGTRTRSMIGFEEKSVDIDTKQLSMEWDPFDFPDPVKQVISPPTQDPVNETNYEASSEQNGEASLYNNDTDVEQIVKEEQHLSEDLNTPEYKILSDASSFSESLEENYCDGILDKISSTRLLNGPLDDSRDYIADPSMKGIDFSDKVKLNDSCVIVNSESLCAVSCRARKLTSYKRLIHDAFASRKRLTKEYEQLAIWYGDIDMESTDCPKENMVPSYAVMPSESQKPPTQDSCDSEWELL